MEGKIPIDSIKRTDPPAVYSGPRIERMYTGATASAVISGEVKLNPMRKLLSVRSDLAADDAGMTVYDILEAKLAITMLIIIAI